MAGGELVHSWSEGSLSRDEAPFLDRRGLLSACGALLSDWSLVCCDRLQPQGEVLEHYWGILDVHVQVDRVECPRGPLWLIEQKCRWRLCDQIKLDMLS